MKSIVRTAVLGIAMLGSPAFAQSGKLEMAGTWLTEDGRAKIRMQHCGDGKDMCGFVVWMRDPVNEKGEPRLDIKNPDPAKRSRPSLGLELMTNLKPSDDTHYEGEIYNADNGKSYNVTLGMESATELQVHGCMLKFLCGSQTWTRVADVAVPTAAPKVVSSGAGKPAKPPAAGAKHDTAPGQAQP